MNYKFNLGNVSINMPGEGKVEVKDINIEVTDFNLKDIPGIIKETRKAFKDIKESLEESTISQQAQQNMNLEEEVDETLEAFLNSMHNDHPIHNILQEAILAANPGAKIIPTPNGFAVAVPVSRGEA